MWKQIKNTVRKLTPKKVKDFFAYQPGDEFASKSYSQEGEDILLKRIFEHSPPGFYVDVGAHHPFRFSNTKLLYDRGWRGINIEANPDALKVFDQFRTRDINVCSGVANKSGTLTYYKYSHPALNSFIPISNSKTPVATVEIAVKTLKQILEELLPPKGTINLLNIDAEGMDLEILESNDWSLFQPDYICVELPLLEIRESLETDITRFLRSKGYSLSCKLFKSCIFKADFM